MIEVARDRVDVRVWRHLAQGLDDGTVRDVASVEYSIRRGQVFLDLRRKDACGAPPEVCVRDEQNLRR